MELSKRLAIAELANIETSAKEQPVVAALNALKEANEIIKNQIRIVNRGQATNSAWGKDIINIGKRLNDLIEDYKEAMGSENN